MKSRQFRRSVGIGGWLMLLLLLLLLLIGALFVYPLSAGPVIWVTSAVTSQSVEAYGILSLIYLPLNFASTVVPEPALELYGQYTMWWLALPGGTLIPVGTP